MSDRVEAVVAAVAASKKYRDVCPDAIRRIAEGEMATHKNMPEAIKSTKRRLHQSYGAFERRFDDVAAYRRLEAAYRSSSQDEIRAACREVMGQHASTRERLPILDRFYAAIFEITGRPGSILDLGCGLNPLALPWMNLGPGARYVALDIDAARVEFLNRTLALAGLEPLARCQDVLVHPPQDEAELALLLKMSPTLERQGEGATVRLIEQLRAPAVVVSFAIKSLGGREKGMLAHYQQQFSGWAEGRQWSVGKWVFDSELVFVVKRDA